jgi:ElaB/YqjD/DUF883 family membrane-anchored ribosome-binding protein
MSSQNYQTERTARSIPEQEDSKEASSTSRLAKSAMDSAQRVGSEAVSTITGQVKALLDEKVGDGANVVGNLASSVHTAAEDLDQSSPQLASLVRGVADRLDGYATDLRDQSVDQLVRAASQYTRRQPAVVFGLAALVGFFALRTIKSTPARSATQNRNRLPQAGGFYGS